MFKVRRGEEVGEKAGKLTPISSASGPQWAARMMRMPIHIPGKTASAPTCQIRMVLHLHVPNMDGVDHPDRASGCESKCTQAHNRQSTTV